MPDVYLPSAATGNDDGSLGVILYSSGAHRRPTMWRELRRELQPFLCRLGRHRVMDIVNCDGSITYGSCSSCEVDTDPHHRSGPDPARVREWERFNRESREVAQAFEDFEGGGPCPLCEMIGFHEPDCFFERDDD